MIIFQKSLAVFIFFSISFHKLIAQSHVVKLQNNAQNSVSFVHYDQFGNYKYYPIAPGKTVEIPFNQEYLNIFPLEDDKDVPYFFFPGDEITITAINNKFYSFESKNQERKKELLLAQTIFTFFQQHSSPAINTSALLKQTKFHIDSILSSNATTKLSAKYKELTQSFYQYQSLREKIKYNADNKIMESYDEYWKEPYNHKLQSYILAFRTYTLSYLPEFSSKENLVSIYDSLFKKEHKEIALYSIMQKAYYKDKPWFRSNYNQYILLSKDIDFYGKLAYFKLTDDVSGNAEEVLLIGATKDTITLKSLMEKLKGNVVLVDLWASWCVPCIEQLPFSENLIKTFDKKPFQVLYLSLDREFHLFNNFSETHLQGKLNYNIVGNFQSSFATLNKITTIPRYMIIDKQGTFVNSKTPLPSNVELKALIEKYL